MKNVMNTDEVTLLKEKLVPHFSKKIKEADTIITGECSFLGLNGDVSIVVDSTKSYSLQSDVARCFTMQSLDCIGLFQGTWDNPKLAMRFIDYKGAIMLVPKNADPIEIWCGGNYFEKASKTSPFLFKKISGNDIYLNLLEDNRASLVISLSPRKENYLRNLVIGSETCFNYCTEFGVVPVSRNNWAEYKKEFTNLDKKYKNKLLTVLKKVNKGYIDHTDKDYQKILSENIPFFEKTKNYLPDDPRARNIWFSALGTI